MRNRDATSQICINCQLNPPIDPEDAQAKPESESPLPTPPAQLLAQAIQPLPLPPIKQALVSPPPTSALPAPPPPRPTTPQNHRVSVLDPMMEVRKALRPIGHRGSIPAPPSTPPPRSSSASKLSSGPLAGKPNIPLPPGPPPSLPLSPPPANFPPQPVLRDMRRSPQSSIILSGSILPPSTPPPPPPAMAAGSIPLSPPTSASELEEGASIATLEQEQSLSRRTSQRVSAMQGASSTRQSLDEPGTASVESEIVSTIKPADDEPAQGLAQESEPTTPAPHPESTELGVEATLESSAIASENQARQNTRAVEDEDDKGMESDDDFEDAEEDVPKATEEEVKERETKREQSERASRLIGQKMLQGWAMLQDPCPNPSCHGVPLLRSREKKEYCVICENYFQREQDLQHGKYTLIPETPSQPPTVTAAAATQGPPGTGSSASLVPENFPPPPLAPSPAIPPPVSSPALPPQFNSPRLKSVSSPISSPSMGRNQREFLGRVSQPIFLPPATTPAQHVLVKHMSEDLDKLASEDEDTRRHMIIRKVGEYSSKSLPPVPMGSPAARPISTYSSDGDRTEIRPRSHMNQRRGETNGPPAPPPVPPSPEIQALASVTNKTIATILVKLEACRSALEVADSPKECQVLTNQIKSFMECLKACREAL
ncbi:MAG: hypothetical protein J3Q66DRAFT_332242 [Benniella sp.]|nr:MAG: hypothetical protein J3Q66DRAFT_332242 [Benniella sp.]